MNEKITALALEREKLKNASLERDEMLNAFHQTEKWKQATQARLDAELSVKQLEEEIRELALASGEKHPHPAVEVKEFTVYDYEDVEAVDYCKKNATVALDIKLNKGIFKKILEKTTLPFVTVRVEHRAQIASDLGKYLDGLK